MPARSSKSPFALLLSSVAVLYVLLTSTVARADESIIRQPGAHRDYSVEIEPHLLASFLMTRAGEGVGAGVRFTIPVVKNGFIASINNNVGIGFGLDWAHYNGCYYYYYYDPLYGYDCPSLNTFVVPVVMQWNFFLAKHWSVFAEPGLALEYGTYGSCPGYYVDRQGNVHNYLCPNGPSHVTLDPVVMFIGGRFHINDTVSLTARLGWPYFSIGLSLFP
jgi:hypothetical protein